MKTSIKRSLLATLLTPGLVVAADNNERDQEHVLVTATRTEQPFSDTISASAILDRADIERIQPRDLTQLLGRISGVDMRDSGGRGSTSGIFLRGAAGSQVLVLIDGVRSASATTGATALESIPVDTIERIEVVKGPLSGIYGADAIGGVIQIFTRRADTDGLSGDITITAGSHELREKTASVGYRTDRARFSASVSKETTDGIDRMSTDAAGNDDKDGFEERSGSLSGEIEFSDKDLVSFSALSGKNISEFDNAFGADAGRFSETEVQNLSVSWQRELSKNTKLNVRHGLFSDHSEIAVFGSDIKTLRRSTGILLSKFIGHSRFSVGIDHDNDEVDTASAFSETERESIGGYVQWQQWWQDAQLVVNLRHDDNEAYGSNLNGSVAFEYRLADGLELYGSYGEAFRAPTFNDLYFPGFGNPNVMPEESVNSELGVRSQMGAVKARFSIWQTEVDNLIGFDLATFTANNIAEAKLEGAELELDAYLLGLDWHWALDYTDARDESTNEYLDDRALWNSLISVGGRSGSISWLVDLQSERGRHDRSGVELDSHSLLGASLIYDIDQNWRLKGRVDNLLDEDYVINVATSSVVYETEGRTAKVSLRYQFD